MMGAAAVVLTRDVKEWNSKVRSREDMIGEGWEGG